MVGFKETNSFSFDELTLPNTPEKMNSVLHPEDGTEAAGHYTEGELEK